MSRAQNGKTALMISAPAIARSAAIARCDQEIARAKAYLRLGLVSTLDGYLWLNDWRTEKLLIEQEPE